MTEPLASKLSSSGLGALGDQRASCVTGPTDAKNAYVDPEVNACPVDVNR